MENYLELFLSQIRIKGSEKTVKDYRRNIGNFMLNCNKQVEDITYNDLVNYYNDKFCGLKTNSKRAYMSAILSFFNFLYKHNYIKDDITKGFILPKAEVTDMEYLNSKESIIAANMCDTEKRNPLRKKAMLITFINTGMRASELSNIKLTDIDSEWINIRNAKGNKFRRVPLHPSVKSAIKNYIEKERDNNSPYLFVNQQGNKLSTVIINRDLESIIGKTSIGKHISAHRLRDSFATIQYINGSDIKSIQETLGHESIQMTLHYVQKVDERRREQVLNSGVQF